MVPYTSVLNGIIDPPPGVPLVAPSKLPGQVGGGVVVPVVVNWLFT